MQKKTHFIHARNLCYFHKNLIYLTFKKYDYMLVLGASFLLQVNIGFFTSFHESCLNFSKQFETFFCCELKRIKTLTCSFLI